MEVIFRIKETAQKFTRNAIENEKCLRFPNNLGSVFRTIRFCSIPPACKPEFVLPAVLKQRGDHKIFTVTTSETLLYWGYGLELVALIEVDDTIIIRGGEQLSVILSACKPDCRIFQRSGY